MSKFKPWISDLCDLCGHHIENPYTLFTQCPFVVSFWGDIKKYLEYFDHDLPTNRLQILFGIHTETYDSVKNIAILLGKRTIWISKLKRIHLTLEHFKNILKDYLIILCLFTRLKNSSSAFSDQWSNFLGLLNGNHFPQLPPGDEKEYWQLDQGNPLHHL